MSPETAYLFAGAIDDWTVLTGGFEFDKYFPNEEVCRAYLSQQRWPWGFVCPRCGDVCSYEMHCRELIECANRKCRYQTSITAGTMFHRTKLPLRKWFKALQLYTWHNVVSPTALRRLIKVSHKTACLMLQKMHEAYKYYDREMLRTLSHPLAAVLTDPYLEEGAGWTEEQLMRVECAQGDEEEGFMPSDPEAAEALSAAGLLMHKRITRDEWQNRRTLKKIMFSTNRWLSPRYFLLQLICCMHAPPLYRILREGLPKPPYEVHYQGSYDAEENAGYNWEVKPEIFAFHRNIAGQLA